MAPLHSRDDRGLVIRHRSLKSFTLDLELNQAIRICRMLPHPPPPFEHRGTVTEADVTMQSASRSTADAAMLSLSRPTVYYSPHHLRLVVTGRWLKFKEC